jgi:cytochrome c peroxidase
MKLTDPEPDRGPPTWLGQLLMCMTLTIAPTIGSACVAAAIAGGEMNKHIQTPVSSPTHLGLPSQEVPSQSLVELGRRLFFDTGLSAAGDRSCATCHVPSQGFTQHDLPTPIGLDGDPLPRNAPTLLNVGYRTVLFADGRAASLEEQVWGPLLDPAEMNNPDRESIVLRLRSSATYRDAFELVFQRLPDADTLAKALAGYQRSLVSADSAFDRWYFGGEADQMNDRAKRGFFLFMRSGCEQCHRIDAGHAHFTDDRFYNTGIGYIRGAADKQRDVGRGAITGDPADLHRFRTPTLRNIARTAPYMHNGSLPTLAAVVDFYNIGGSADLTKDPLLQPLKLTPAGMTDLVAFLQSLSGKGPL